MNLRLGRALLALGVAAACGQRLAEGPDPVLPVEGRYMVEFEGLTPACDGDPYLPTGYPRPDAGEHGWDMVVLHPDGRFRLAWGEWTSGGALRCFVDTRGEFVCPPHRYWDTTLRDNIPENEWRLAFQLRGAIDEGGEALRVWSPVTAECFGRGCVGPWGGSKFCTFDFNLRVTLRSAEPFVDPRDVAAGQP